MQTSVMENSNSPNEQNQTSTVRERIIYSMYIQQKKSLFYCLVYITQPKKLLQDI